MQITDFDLEIEAHLNGAMNSLFVTDRKKEQIKKGYEDESEYCIVLKMEIVYENMKIIHCMTLWYYMGNIKVDELVTKIIIKKKHNNNNNSSQ